MSSLSSRHRSRALGLALPALLIAGVAGSATLKSPEWVRFADDRGRKLVDQGTAVGTDVNGNVFVLVSGHRRATGPDYQVLKYNSTGRLLWEYWYDSPSHLADFPSELAVDSQGNVVVTGRSQVDNSPESAWEYATVKLSGEGTLLWAQRHLGDRSPSVEHYPGDYGDEPVHLALAADDSVYVAGDMPMGDRSVGYLTLKYSADGSELWAQPYAGEEGFGFIRGVTVTPDNGVAVTGQWRDDDFADYVTVRYSAAGEEEWVARAAGSGESTDIPRAIASAADGSVYVTGSSGGALFTVKYSDAGEEAWRDRYPNPLTVGADGTCLAVDPSGNVCIGGAVWVAATPGTTDALLLSYTPEGTQRWTVTWDGGQSLTDRFKDLAIDATGSVYATGYLNFDNNHASKLNYGTVKVRSNGSIAWEAAYDGPIHSLDEPAALALDPAGNAYVTGISGLTGRPSFGVDYGAATVKYQAEEAATATLAELTPRVTSVRGGKPISGSVRLSAPAPASLHVTLTSSNPDLVVVPAGGVKVGRGRTSGLFTLRTRKVTEPTEVTLTATLDGVSRQVTLTLRP